MWKTVSVCKLEPPKVSGQHQMLLEVAVRVRDAKLELVAGVFMKQLQLQIPPRPTPSPYIRVIDSSPFWKKTGENNAKGLSSGEIGTAEG